MSPRHEGLPKSELIELVEELEKKVAGLEKKIFDAGSVAGQFPGKLPATLGCAIASLIV